MKNIAALLLSLVLAVPALAREVVKARKLRVATLRELAAKPAPEPMARENRHTEKRRRGPTSASTGRVEAVAGTARLTGISSMAPPPVAVAFPSDSSRIYSPADASGAAGRQHVVSASNISIIVHARTGGQLARLTLNQFWESWAGADIYDPRLVYDIESDRWVTIAIRDGQELLVAVSATGDPLGAWHRYAIHVSEADFTRLALTRNSVLASTISGDNGYLVSILKEPFYLGRPMLSATTRYLHANAVPVHAPDDDAEYVVEGEYGALTVRRLDAQPMTVRRYEAGFAWDYDFGATAPQFGTGNQLDLGYPDVETAVLHDGFLYAVHRAGEGPRTPDGNALIWWKVDPESEAAEIGIIDGPELYAYPSLAVNRSGAMLISYCVFSATRYPSAAYVYRDPAGRVSLPGEIRNGNSAATNTDRWGDYTTVTVDPLNRRDFWVGQIATDKNVWQTWWAHIPAPEAKKRVVRK